LLTPAGSSMTCRRMRTDLLIHRFAVSIRLPRAAPARPPAPGPWHGPGRRRAGRIVQLRKEQFEHMMQAKSSDNEFAFSVT
jgi:hypothetical protein